GLYRRFVERAAGGDANDRLYQLEASMDYDPLPLLDRIKAAVLAINFADDELNPAALGTLEAGIAKVKNGRAKLLAAGPGARGHHSALYASLWKAELEALIAQLDELKT